jgi:hypothetical protein
MNELDPKTYYLIGPVLDTAEEIAYIMNMHNLEDDYTYPFLEENNW